MGRKLPPELEVLVKALSKEGRTERAIVEELKNRGHVISKATVHRIICVEGKRRQSMAQGLGSPKKSQPRPKRTEEVVKKVRQMTSKENPPSQRQMAKMLGVSAKTIRRVINEELGQEERKKGEVHVLEPSPVQVMASTNGSCVQCLICYSSVELEETETSAKSSSSSRSSFVLEQNLQIYFILRHVLELPSERLESYFRNCPSNLDDWVKICNVCRIGYVRKCENIFTELLEVKRRFRDAQLELIGVIKERSVNGNICGKGGGSCKEDEGEFILDINKEIRRFVEERKYERQKGDPFVTGDILAREKLAREKEIQPDEIKEKKKPEVVSSKSHCRHHGNEDVDVVKREVESLNSNIIGNEECEEENVDYHNNLDTTEFSPKAGNFTVEDNEWNVEDEDAHLKSSEASDASSTEDNDGDNYTKNHSKCQHDEKIEKDIFLCEFCPEKYDTNNGLNRHMKYSHGKETGKFLCFVCGKFFTSQKVLKNHIYMMHERKYEMVCDICGKMMVSQHYMKRHKAKVHNVGSEEFRRFPCSVEGCSRVFQSDAKRRLHIRVKHEGAIPLTVPV